MAALLGALGACLVPSVAKAQQKTFHLDRLEIPGAPDDGIAIFRPQTQQRNIVYGQLGIGYSFQPLRTRNVTVDSGTLNRSKFAVISNQLAIYGSAGFEFLDRVVIGVNFPWYPVQTGENPSYPSGGIQGSGQGTTTRISAGGPTAGDLRLDLRGTVLRSQDRKSQLGLQLSLFAPSGTASDLGGDNGTGALALVTAEHTIKWITLVANTGFHFRPRHAINDPSNGSGLGVSDEWRWAVGGFVPLRDGKYRIGATIFGQTGLTGSDKIVGDTFFTKQNTPIEFQVEGRMKFGPSDHFWMGLGVGSAILRGYGAPDVRGVALIGAYVPILDSSPTSPPDRRAENRERHRQEHNADRDHDGIPDDIDACPDEPEDHLGNDPSDGCPLPPDRDHDGIPDQFDKCPDVPEDKDGIDDGDGCPEEDADSDGIPDVTDACPKEPGPSNPNPKQNGCPTTFVRENGKIRVFKQVHFATGSATILPDSFPMLQEIANLLKSNPGIQRMSIDGHTDNRGSADLNKKLSQDRANSVMAWLVQHTIAQDRLEAHGYGLEKPTSDNNTDEGRAANRRVEFNILKEDDPNAIGKKP